MKFPRISDMNGEDRLDLEFVKLEPSTAEDEIDYCNDYLKTTDGELNPLIEKIQSAHFEKLFNEVSKMRLPTESYLSGLKILFGLDEKQIVPMFQPVFLSRVTSGVPGNHTYIPKFGLYYNYDYTNGFSVAKEGDFDRLSNYRKSIQIKRQTGNYTAFNSKDDVEGVIFPFQTIYTLLNDNTENFANLYNAIRFVEGEAKHCVLLTTQVAPFNFGLLEDKYANRSHLCPPCTVVEKVHTLKP